MFIGLLRFLAGPPSRGEMTAALLPAEGACIADPPALENPAGEGGWGGVLQLDSRVGGPVRVSCTYGAPYQGPRPIQRPTKVSYCPLKSEKEEIKF